MEEHLTESACPNACRQSGPDREKTSFFFSESDGAVDRGIYGQGSVHDAFH